MYTGVPLCLFFTAQANPSLPVVERLEDLWLLSRLQQERKAAQQQQEQAANQLQQPQAHTALGSAGSAAPDHANVTAGAGVVQQAGTPVAQATPASIVPETVAAVPDASRGEAQPATTASSDSAADAQPCTARASAEGVSGSSVVASAAAAPVSWLYDLD
jgi:rhamnose utilization protein RhaD (predicted bifunctional aldolase and dehydrogenase)